jgi:DNA-binding NtrC family response regulator
MAVAKHIAIVDDEKSVHTIFKGRFRHEIREGSLMLHYFFDGEDCYDFIGSDSNDINFSLIICDINMPKMDGFTFLELARSNYPDLDICMCSAYGSEEYLEKAKSLGAFEYLTKPLNFKKLKDLVTKKLNLPNPDS